MVEILAAGHLDDPEVGFGLQQAILEEVASGRRGPTALMWSSAPYVGATRPAYGLAEWRASDVLLHCLNPDRIVIHGDERMICAGALADAYEALGGRVCWYGKPHVATYDHALRLGGSPPKAAVLAIGDGLKTDVLGAANYGIDCIFVEGGIHAGEPFPEDLAPGWRPLAVVPSLC